MLLPPEAFSSQKKTLARLACLCLKMASKLSISDVNELDYREFIHKLGNVVEMTQLCVAAVCARRPFSSFDSFYLGKVAHGSMY